jgi:hypothetical protein
MMPFELVVMSLVTVTTGGGGNLSLMKWLGSLQ